MADAAAEDIAALRARLARLGVDAADASSSAARVSQALSPARDEAGARRGEALTSPPVPSSWEGELIDILQRCNEIDRALAEGRSNVQAAVATPAPSECAPSPAPPVDEVAVAAAASAAATAAATAAREAAVCAAAVSPSRASARAHGGAANTTVIPASLPISDVQPAAEVVEAPPRRAVVKKKRPKSAVAKAGGVRSSGAGGAPVQRVRGAAYGDNSGESSAFWLRRCRAVERAAKEAEAEAARERVRLRRAAEQERRAAVDARSKASAAALEVGRLKAEVAALKECVSERDRSNTQLEACLDDFEQRARAERRALGDAVANLTSQRDELTVMLSSAMVRLETLTGAVKVADAAGEAVADKVRALEAEHTKALEEARAAQRRLAEVEAERQLSLQGHEALAQFSSLQLSQYRQRREMLQVVRASARANALACASVRTRGRAKMRRGSRLIFVLTLPCANARARVHRTSSAAPTPPGAVTLPTSPSSSRRHMRCLAIFRPPRRRMPPHSSLSLPKSRCSAIATHKCTCAA